MAKKKVTSSDVAKRAGVSQATVSMVLNKKYNVSFSKEVSGTPMDSPICSMLILSSIA